MTTRSVFEFAAFALLLGGIGTMIIWAFSGCAAADSASVVANYERELDHCREVGKVSHSFDVYDACARAVDRRLCAQRGVRCVETDGGVE